MYLICEKLKNILYLAYFLSLSHIVNFGINSSKDDIRLQTIKKILRAERELI
jgi:hypothetical protein